MSETNTSKMKGTTNAKFAEINESNRKKITELEKKIQNETGEKVALVAYHID